MNIILLVALLVLLAIIILSHFYAGWLLKFMVGSKHKDIQIVYETGEVPKIWKNPEKRIVSLMNYVKKSKLMADEDTREEVLEALKDALEAHKTEDKNRNDT